MASHLRRLTHSLPRLLFFLLLLAAAAPARATHLLGGEMTYRYLDANGPAAAPYRYEITVSVYNNCASTVLGTSAPIAIYDKATGNQENLSALNYAGSGTISGGIVYLPQTSLDLCTTPVIPPGCTITGSSQSYRLQKFVGVFNLPAASQGYYAYWSAYARNAGINNIASSNTQYMTLYTTLALPALANRSPVFVDKAVANLCINDTTYILNNAVDPDGDQLVYSFGQPYGEDYYTTFIPPPDLVPYSAAQYTATTPLGTAAGNYASINAATGIAKFRTNAALNSKFVVAVDVQEYRVLNGVSTLIGTTRRDVQLVVVSCPNTVAPVLPTQAATSPTPRNYTIEAGSTLTIPLTATQADGHPLTLTASSVLLDGVGGYNATFAGQAGTVLAGNPAGSVTVSSTTSPVSGTFVYTAACADARATPYDVTVTVKDDGCAGKTVGDVLRITVVKATGPTAIGGPAAVCGLNTTQAYTSSGGTSPQVSWSLSGGGTIVGSSTANPVQVSWTTAGTYTLTAQGFNQYNCPTGTTTKTVTVAPPPTVGVTGALTICQGGSTTLALTGGAPYTLTNGMTTQTGNGPFTLSPAQTTTYILTGTANAAGCIPTGQVTITVNALPAATVGATPRTTCSGAPLTLGAAPVAGTTYSWSPATGLSSATVANPTLTLTNTSGAAITQTYTLTATATATNCQATSAVTVTVNPAVTALPGAAVSVCSGSPAQLGAAPVAGYSYSWTPATGLSSATVANPTVMLTNPTSAATTQTYTLTTTNPATGCTGTGTVIVTVNPAATALPGPAVSFCSGNSAQLGAAPVAGYTYSWTPATGLSSATVANPTVTLTNTTGATITQTYTLTATSAAGCVATGTVAVTVLPAVTAAPGGALTLCSGSTGQLGGAPVAGYTYSWSPATGLSSATAANPTVTLTNATSAATITTYTLTASAGSCTSTGTVNVTVNPAAVAQAGAAATICSGGLAQLGATPVAGYTYSWAPTAGLSSSTVANPTVTLTNTTSAPATTTYTLTTTGGSCTGTSTVAVTVNPAVVAQPGAAVSFCSGSSAQLGAAPVTGYTYAWSPATGLNSATVANPTLTLPNTTGASTTTTYTLTVTSAAGCTGTGTVAVTVHPAAIAQAGAAVSFCSGGTAQLGAAPVAGYTYSWTPATGLSNPNITNPTVTLTNTTSAASTTTYTLTVTSVAGCPGTGTVDVTVNPAVAVVPGANVAICSGNTAQLGAAPVAGLTYSWSPATGLSNPNIANPTVTLTNTTNAAATQVYTLTTSAGSCTSTGTVTVTINPAVVAQPGPAVSFCSGNSAQLGDVPVAGYTYSWTPATGLSSPNIANPTVTLTNNTSTTTTQTYTLTATSPAGCSSTATVLVTVPAPATAVPGTPVAICSGGAGQLGAAPVAGYTYSWTPATGLSSATVANPTVTLTNTTSAAITTTYTLTTGGSCTSTSTVAVTVNPTVVAAPGAAVTICSGGAAQLGAAPVAGYVYSWSPATGLSSATVADPTVTLTNTTSAATTQTYTLTTTSAAGCVGTGTVTVTVNPSVTTQPGVAVSFCSGSSAQLGAAPVAGYTYSWTPTAGLSSATVANPTVMLTNTTSAPITTTYTLTTTTAAGCLSTSTVPVTVNPATTAVAGAAATICSGASAQVGGAPLAGYSYSWSPTTGLSSSTVANPTVTLTNPTSAATTQTYTLTTTSAAGCVGTGTVNVTVNPAVVAQPGAAVSFCSGSSAQLGVAPVAGYTYAWSPATGLSSATVANPIVTLTNATSAPATTTYTLTVTSAAGCTGTGTVDVTVNPAVAVQPGAALAVCSGLPGQLGAAPVAGYTYSWSPATGLSNPGIANPTVTLTNTTSAPATTTYTLTTTGGSCTGTSTVAVTVNPAVVAQPGAAVSFCSGSSAQLGAAPVTGYTYAWSPATGLNSATVANPTLTLPNTTGASTTTTYTLTVTSAAGCTGTGTVAVTVHPAAIAQAGAAVSFCSGGTAQLGAAPVAGYTYSWTPATGLSNPNITNPTVTLTNTTSAASTTTYTLTVTSVAGCPGTGTVDVTVNPAVAVVPGTAVSFCSGSSAQLGAAPVAGYTYSWSPATGLSSATVANPTVTLTNLTSAPVTTTYTLTTNVGSCTSTSTVAVTVNPAAVAAPGAPVTTCSGGTAQLGAAPVAGYTYSWTPATGLSSATVPNPTVTLTNTTGAAITQTYTLTTSAAGCVSTGTVAVTVNPAVEAVPGAAVAICSGGAGQLGAAPVAGYTYSWTPATGLSSATVANPTITLTNTTSAAITTTYTLTTTNLATGCVGTGTVAVTVNPAVTATVPGTPVTLCPGLTGQLGSAPVAGYSYSWSPTTGLSSSTVANPTVTLTNLTTAAITQTYTLTTTSPSGCSSMSTVAVTVNPAVTALPGAGITICSGLTGQLGSAPVPGLTYSWTPATGLSSATVANPTVTLTNPSGAVATTTYTLTTTNAATGCLGTGTVAVTVDPAVTALPGAALTLCSGATGQLGAAPVTGYSYNWTPATGLSDPTIANPTATLTNTTGAATTQTYTLTTTSAAGCVGTGTVTITVNSAVTALPGAAVTFCSGLTGQLGSTPVAGYTYSWTPATGLSDPSSANPTVTLTNTTGAATTTTYLLTAINTATGCLGTGTVAVTVNPAATALPGPAVSFCSGNSAQLGAAPVAGYTYSWTPTTGLSSTTVANPIITLTNPTGAATTQTYTLTTTSAAGCVGTGTVAVTINPAVTALPGPAITICSGLTGQLGAAPVTGYTYSWAPATGLSDPTIANPTVTLTNTTSAAATQTYTLTTTSTAGCVGTGTVTATVSPAVTALPGAALAICSGLPGQLGNAPVAGLTYSWTPATGLSSATVANPTLTLTNTSGAAITQMYTLTATNPATGCLATGTVVVTVNPAVTALPGAAVTSCSGSSVQLGAAPVPGYTYSWTPATGLSSATAAYPTVTLTNTTSAATTQTYTLTTTSGAGCVGTGTVTVTVLPAVVAGAIGTTQTVCAGNTPTPLTSTASASGGTGTFTYQWESSPDNLTWTAVPSATGLTYAPGPVTATQYYRRRVTANPCGQFFSNVVAVLLQQRPTTTVALAPPAPQCPGTAFTFTAVAANAGPTPTYSWFVNNVLVASAPTFTSSTLTTGDQVRVELTATPGFCVSGSAQATVTYQLIPPATPPVVVVAPTTVLPACLGAPISFRISSAAPLGAVSQYQWRVDGVAVAGATAATFTTTTLRDGQVVSLQLTTSTRCAPITVVSNAVPVSINPVVAVDAGPNQTITEGDEVVLQGTANGTYPVTWTPTAGLTFAGSNQLQPRAAPLATTTYTLSAGAGSCTDASSVTVTVLPRIHIPSAFSPNGDGVDDVWQIDRIDDYLVNHVLVFNRWGNKVFESAAYHTGAEWNGTVNGQPAPVGTYYYIITLSSGKSYTGPLTIIY